MFIHILQNALLDLPFINFSLFRRPRSNDLVTIQQTQWIKCPLELPHCVDCGLAKLVLQVVALDQTYSVFTSCCTLELDCALYHIMNKVFCLFILGIAVVENDSCSQLALCSQ